MADRTEVVSVTIQNAEVVMVRFKEQEVVFSRSQGYPTQMICSFQAIRIQTTVGKKNETENSIVCGRQE